MSPPPIFPSRRTSRLGDGEETGSWFPIGQSNLTQPIALMSAAATPQKAVPAVKSSALTDRGTGWMAIR